MSRLFANIFTETSVGANEANIAWQVLRMRLLEKVNQELDADDIVSIQESKSVTEIHPDMSNSDTWYLQRNLTLIVYHR